MKYPIRLFNFLQDVWEDKMTPRVISSSLILSFIVGLLLVFLSQLSIIDAARLKFLDQGYFLAINIAFTLLLIFEILGLVFVLPKSVADSVGRQFEILSIILLRAAFKEFGSFDQSVEWSRVLAEPLYHVLSDAFGALVIFLIIGIYYNSQKHETITTTDRERQQFIDFKKLLAFLLLIVFVALGVVDIRNLLLTGEYHGSFNTFYTVLIFSDILILLYSLRYSSRYYNLFRYSSFALATVLIRLSLTAPPYVNVIIGVAAGLFVLGLTFAYNNFIRGQASQSSA